MRLTHELDLDSSPQAVQAARRWIVSACDALERSDLADSAELCLSELVTNALLHARPPIRLVVAGTRRHPRVEVHDGSPRLPVLEDPALVSEDEVLSTVGRGLSIVSMLSHVWGADVDIDGKVVWFEPAVEPDGQSAPVIHYAQGAIPSPRRPPDNGVQIDLIGFPHRLFLDFRQQFRDVRRELRLLAIAHGSDFPLGSEVTAVFDRFDDIYAHTLGTEQLERAVLSDTPSSDVALTVPAETPRVMGQLDALLDLADEFAASERLLSLVSSDRQRDFRRWLFGEFLRQHEGQLALPWPEAVAATAEGPAAANSRPDSSTPPTSPPPA